MTTPAALSLTAATLLAVGTRGAAHAAPDAYPAHRASTAAGLLAADEAAWSDATTIEWGPAPYETRFRALWDTAGLWLRFDARDRDPWHTMTARDDHLWEEEVVEIFIDPDGDGREYVEVEISPANVVCDLLIHRAQPQLHSTLEWDFESLRTVVNKHPDSDDWTAIAFLPWTGFARVPGADAVQLPPAPGHRWQFNVFRIKRPGGPEAPRQDAVLAAWSPPPGPSFHAPEVFREMEFQP